MISLENLKERPIYKLLNPFINELKKRVIEYYRDNLVSGVIFGSYARGEVSLYSDLDLLIILEESSLRIFERCREFWENVESRIKTKYFLSISPFIKTKEEAVFFSNLYLDIIESNLILYDKDNFFKNLMKKVRDLFEEGIVEKIISNDKIYWRINDEEKAYRRLL